MEKHAGVDIPSRSKVLVIGGGPAGSYSASALAREGIDVVLLEADTFPRYHIGESMLPAMRFLLKFIDADRKFVNHGFTKKTGAAFKLTVNKREGYTDFLDVGGPENYVWNVVRSEADEILFRHAAESGAKVFDGVKVTSILFGEVNDQKASRPVKAIYTRKSDAISGEIEFDYLVDASGRSGILSTRYLKNRIHNCSLNNIASWAYWSNTKKYAAGTSRENSPFFEALTDESGWAWFIPLHIGTSVGIVMDKTVLASKKAQNSTLSGQDLYLQQLELAPSVLSLIGDGSLIIPSDGASAIRSGIDASYSARSYGAENFRICGDAGAFIDPFFSTGVHLALIGGLSAALTICASLRGDCSEKDAAKWHSDRIASTYTWFLMVVLGAYKQMRRQSEPVLSDIDKDNFDLAFSDIRPVIQGSMDIEGSYTHAELLKTLDLCSKILGFSQPEDRESVLRKLQTLPPETRSPASSEDADTDRRGQRDEVQMEKVISSESEKSAFDYIETRKIIRPAAKLYSIESFATTVINGMVPRLEHGQLGLKDYGH
ncbi:HAL2 [Sanghuangporus vaninii]